MDNILTAFFEQHPINDLLENQCNFSVDEGVYLTYKYNDSEYNGNLSIYSYIGEPFIDYSTFSQLLYVTIEIPETLSYGECGRYLDVGEDVILSLMNKVGATSYNINYDYGCMEASIDLLRDGESVIIIRAKKGHPLESKFKYAVTLSKN